jgi:SAM-dependent methyltransferase
MVNCSFYKDAKTYQNNLQLKDDASFNEHISFVRSYIPKAAKILDVGCGAGQTVKLLRQNGYDTVGCDLYAGGISGLGKIACGDGGCLPFEDGAFDAVVSCDYLEHVPNPGQALSEMARVTAPGGLVLVHSPNLLSPIHPLKAIFCYRRLYRRQGIPFDSPFGKTAASLGLTAVKNLGLLCRKNMSPTCRFNFRTPDYNRPEIGDMDASWWCNPVDIKRWIQERGHQMICYQQKGRTRLLGSLASGIQIVFKKLKQ